MMTLVIQTVMKILSGIVLMIGFYSVITQGEITSGHLMTILIPASSTASK